ncbi:MAG: hypothetical protein QOD84_711 [Acidobacteriaceae bacterium]|jgi:hypothetical protein
MEVRQILPLYAGDVTSRIALPKRKMRWAIFDASDRRNREHESEFRYETASHFLAIDSS